MGTLQPQNQRNWSVQLGTAPCHLETSAADPHLVLPVLAAVLLWNRWASQPPRRVESDNGWEFGGSLTSMSPKNCHFLSYFCSLTSHNLGTMMFNRHGKNTNGSSSLTQLLNFQTSPKTEERDDDNILYISACLFFSQFIWGRFQTLPICIISVMSLEGWIHRAIPWDMPSSWWWCWWCPDANNAVGEGKSPSFHG